MTQDKKQYKRKYKSTLDERRTTDYWMNRALEDEAKRAHREVMSEYPDEPV